MLVIGESFFQIQLVDGRVLCVKGENIAPDLQPSTIVSYAAGNGIQSEAQIGGVDKNTWYGSLNFSKAFLSTITNRLLFGNEDTLFIRTNVL